MSNEQRAHDITMLYVQISMKPTFEELQSGQVNRDPYVIYMEIYPEVLEKVNRDFPNN